MASKVLMGIYDISLAPLAVDGGPGTVFTPWGQTLEDSFSWDTEDGTEQTVMVEEVEDAILSKESKGATTLTWQIPTIDLAKLVDIVGGTYTAATKTWEAPLGNHSVERTVKVKSDGGDEIIFTRVKFSNRIGGNGAFGRNNLLPVNISGKLLAPTKAATAPYSIVDKSV